MMTPKKIQVRVRFAPSPTGPVHLGTARAALMNWLFAKGNEGKFILRIEDTDRERSRKEYEENILESLRWLGLLWDEFYRQSERLDRYTEHLTRLLEQGSAYRCFCSPEELAAERESQEIAGIFPRYGGKCRSIPKNESERRAKLESHVIRFRMPEKKISFKDLVRGKVSFDLSLFDDIIIAKGLREPLYNFAATVDDHEMDVTHVIRGEDHLSNTPKQLALAEALGFAPPDFFVHVPLILGHDGKKLSKRDLAKSLLDYRDEGYLPNALLNFLALLGWHPKADREILSLQEMTREFSFDRVQKSGAILNLKKLEWMNARYHRELSDAEFLTQVSSLLPAAWTKESKKLERVIRLERERFRGTEDFKENIACFFELSEYEPKLLSWKDAPASKVVENLSSAHRALEAINEIDFTATVVERALKVLAEREGRGEVFWPLRVALTGKKNSPGPFECAEVLGKKEVLSRIEKALKKLS